MKYITLISQCWYFPKEKVTVYERERRIRVEGTWSEFINKLALFIPQNLLAILARDDNIFIKEKSQGDHRNLIKQNTVTSVVTSSPRSTGTFVTWFTVSVTCQNVHLHLLLKIPWWIRKLVSAYKFSTLGCETSFTLKIVSIITN